MYVERRQKSEGIVPESIGKVVFVDLAGGDRVRAGDDGGDPLVNNDMHNINLSLFALGINNFLFISKFLIFV